MVTEGLAADLVRALADACLKKILASPLEIDGKSITISFSGGLVIHPRPATPSQLVHLADSALYEAKRQGRGRVIEIAAE